MVGQKNTQHPVKVLFLDFDKVFWTKRTDISDYGFADPVISSFVSYLCSHYGYQIVDISNIRHRYQDHEEFEAFMSIHGCGQLSEFLFTNPRQMFKTTDVNMECRALEVEDWLCDYRNRFHDDPRFMIITVENRMGNISRFGSKTVVIENEKNGMGVKEFQKCLDIAEQQKR